MKLYTVIIHKHEEKKHTLRAQQKLPWEGSNKILSAVESRLPDFRDAHRFQVWNGQMIAEAEVHQAGVSC